MIHTEPRPFMVVMGPSDQGTHRDMDPRWFYGEYPNRGLDATEMNHLDVTPVKIKNHFFKPITPDVARPPPVGLPSAV